MSWHFVFSLGVCSWDAGTFEEEGISLLDHDHAICWRSITKHPIPNSLSMATYSLIHHVKFICWLIPTEHHAYHACSFCSNASSHFKYCFKKLSISVPNSLFLWKAEWLIPFLKHLHLPSPMRSNCIAVLVFLLTISFVTSLSDLVEDKMSVCLSVSLSCLPPCTVSFPHRRRGEQKVFHSSPTISPNLFRLSFSSTLPSDPFVCPPAWLQPPLGLLTIPPAASRPLRIVSRPHLEQTGGPLCWRHRGLPPGWWL